MPILNRVRAWRADRATKAGLRHLERWADDMRGEWPEDDGGFGYVDYRISCRDTLVESPDVKNETLAACARHLLTAAEHIRAAKPADQADEALVTVMLFWPDFWASRVCVYLNEGVFRHEFQFGPDTPSGPSFAERLNFEVPDTFEAEGTILGLLSAYRAENEEDEDYMPPEDDRPWGLPAFEGCDEHQRWLYVEKGHPWYRALRRA